LLLAALGVALVGAEVRAQPQPPPASDPAADAEKRFLAGEELYRAGKYLEAAAEYQEAYRLSKLPGLLFNVAQSFRLADRPQEALDHYREFLVRAPEHQLAAVAREHIAALEKVIAAETTPPAPGEQPRRHDQPQPPQHAPAPAMITRTAPADARGRELRVAGLASAAVGVGLLGVGVYHGLRARDASSTIDDNDGPWTDDLIDRYHEGERAETRALVFGAVGATGLVAGGVLYWLGWRQGAEASIAVGPGSAAIAVTGRY
jgi:tetratricopeptide (TPR) repeat protein